MWFATEVVLPRQLCRNKCGQGCVDQSLWTARSWLPLDQCGVHGMSFSVCELSSDLPHQEPFILFSFSFFLYTSTHLAMVPVQFM